MTSTATVPTAPAVDLNACGGSIADTLTRMVRSRVATLRARGFGVTRVVGDKDPPLGWNKRSREVDEFGPADNLGIMGGGNSDCGKPGHSLMIVEGDTPAAIALMEQRLPHTLMREGRLSKGWDHWGFARLRAQGRFTRPAVCEDAKAEHKLTSSPARRFLTERYEGGEPGGAVPASDLYAAYLVWAGTNGHKATLDSDRFSKEVRAAFPVVGGEARPKKFAGVAKRAWVGIRERREDG